MLKTKVLSALPWLALLAGVVLFNLHFLGWWRLPFWQSLTVTTGILGALGLLLGGRELRQGLVAVTSRDWRNSLLLGLAAAAVLYAIFWVGGLVAREILPFAQSELGGIYRWKGNLSPWRMGVLMALVIGPGEELFWRGYLQKKMTGRYALGGVALVVAAYGLAHLATGNRMLMIAALTCGAFWGLLYWRLQNIWVNIVSHVAWDIAVFLIFPLH